MAGITVDLKKMQGTVKSGINKGVSDLNSAVSIISGAKIPKDFPAGAKAKGYNNEIQDVVKTLNSVSNWIDTTVNKFEQTEAKNKALVESLIGGFSTSSNANAPSSGYAARSGQKTGKTTTFGEGLSAFFSNFRSEKTGAKVTTSTHLYGSASSYAASSGNRYGANTKTTTMGDGWKALGRSFKDGAEELKRVGCDVVNGTIAFGKGALNVGEGIIKAGKVINSIFKTPGTLLIDGASYLWNNAMGSPEKYKSQTKKMWDKTMTFVSTKHVDNAINNFYKNTSVGRYLDKNAHEPFKSDGTACNIISGMGTVAGVVAITVATAGIGGALGVATGSTTTIMSGVAGASTFGNATGEYWAKAESNSWQGVEKQYKNGTIDKKTYQNYSKVRKMSAKEWNNVIKQYKNGKMSKSEYEQLKKIREMPEDWKNAKNVVKGIFYGGAHGAWEAGQYYVGGKLAKWKGLSTPLKTSAVRVGIDTGFNALDTPFKAAVDAATSDKSYTQAFQERGGWKQVGADATVGFVMSAAGEFSNYKKSNEFEKIDNSKAEIEMNNLKIEDVDAGTGKANNKKTEKIEIDESNVRNNSTTNKETQNSEKIIDRPKNNKDLGETFEYLSTANGKYGVDQGVLDDLYFYQTPTGNLISRNSYDYIYYTTNNVPLKKVANKEYFRIKNVMRERYNMSAKDASKVISALDSEGACSYANVANNIFSQFKDSPEVFEKIFGFPLYKQAENGLLTINDTELLVDIWVNVNNKANGGKILTTGVDGITRVNSDAIMTDINNASKLTSGNAQQYLSTSMGYNEEVIERYISSKSNKIKAKTKTLFSGSSPISDKKMNDVINSAKKALDNGESLYLGVHRNDKPINFIDMKTGKVSESTFTWSEGGGHATFVTEIRPEGFVVSTWGKKRLVLFSDLRDSGNFNISSFKFEKKTIKDKIKTTIKGKLKKK